MIIAVYILFALLIAFMGGYLLKHQNDLFGMKPAKLGASIRIFAYLYCILAFLIVISTIFYKDAAIPTALFVIIATLMTTVLAVSVSRKLFN